MCWRDTRWLWWGWFLSAPALLAADESTAEVHKRLATVFQQADTNHDEKLSIDEFLVGRDTPAIVRRNFKMCDFNDDQHLSLDEFLTVPSLVVAKHRGPIPDIIAGLVDQMVATLDAACDNWDKEPQRELSADRMFEAIAGQLHRLTGNGGISGGTNQMDPDHSGMVTRAEARRYFEICMGIRSSEGVILRHPNGRVINQLPFLECDEDRDNRLDEHEFTLAVSNTTASIAEFADADQDHDGYVSLKEWVERKNLEFFDPVDEFLRIDTNLDARLDSEELITGTPKSQQELAKRVFPVFDWNSDGVLTLAEYRTTMQANPIVDWNEPLYGSREEPEKLFFGGFYRDYRVDVPFLRLMYFQRLDANGDKKLDAEEWSFRFRESDTFFVMNEEGTGWKPFYRSKEYRALTAPAVSPDGKMVAFGIEDEEKKIWRILTVPINGGSSKDVVNGKSPSWSPDRRSLIFSSAESRPSLWGIWQLRLTEADAPPIQLLTEGFGPVWSPDGKQIALAKSQAIYVYDPVEQKITDVLAPVGNPYRQINSNIVWSPEGKRLCFVGFKTAGVAEVGLLDLTDVAPRLKIRHTLRSRAFVRFAWHPQTNRIVFSTYCRERKQTQLYEFDPTSDDPPKLVLGQDATRNNTDACWTPDGKRLIVISGDF